MYGKKFLWKTLNIPTEKPKSTQTKCPKSTGKKESKFQLFHSPKWGRKPSSTYSKLLSGKSLELIAALLGLMRGGGGGGLFSLRRREYYIRAIRYEEKIDE